MSYFYTRMFLEFDEMFEQIHGKEISYNNLLDIDAAVGLIRDFDGTGFAILKHNNACGLAIRPNLLDAWKDALAGDPVSAFGGVLITNTEVDAQSAEVIDYESDTEETEPIDLDGTMLGNKLGED